MNDVFLWKRMRPLRFVTVYILISICIIFVSLECCARVLHIALPLPSHYSEFINDYRLPFRERPNCISHITSWPAGHEFEFVCKTNSQGFRDSEHNLEKSRGTFRILALGDSFTFGAGAPSEGTYPSQLGELLNEPKHQFMPVEVINAGQRRYWPEPERLLLETIGIKYKPDLILVEFTPNDIGDMQLGMSFIKVKRGYLLSKEGYKFGDVGIWLYNNSYLCRIIIRIYLDQKIKHLTNSRLQEIRWEEIFKPQGYHEKDWLQVEFEYERMIGIANKIAARIVFVYVPTRPYENKYALKRLSDWGTRNGVLVVDTLSAINKASKSEKVFWDKDVHCTAAGYRVIAETVCSNLINRHFIPTRHEQ